MVKAINDLTFEQVGNLLTYEADTGVFRWRPRDNRYVVPGAVAGCLNVNGYVNIRIRKRSYKAHRLAVLLMTGAWPTDQVDHINGDRRDNRWVNLRQATFGENAVNRGTNRNNASGCRGVHWHVLRGAWVATVRKDRRIVWTGTFETKEAAVLAVRAKAEEHYGRFFRPTAFGVSAAVGAACR